MGKSKSSSAPSPRLHAIQALRLAYEALIVFEWEHVNRIYGRVILPIPYQTRAAISWATGWSELRRAVDAMAEFFVIPDEYVWLMRGWMPCTISNPNPVGKWDECIEQAKTLSESVVKERYIDPPIDRDRAIRQALAWIAKGGRTGRPPDADRKGDERIVESWASGLYRTYADLAKELRVTSREVKLALDRDRKRAPE